MKQYAIHMKYIPTLTLILLCLICSSCIKRQLNLYEEDPNRKQKVVSEPDFTYPFNKETQSKNIEIVIHTKDGKQVKALTAKMPVLKYNKQLLVMITQDDCKQRAFCSIWAAINGKPLSYNYYYNLPHLQINDLPPDTYYLNKTLGSTDGTGREVRFSFTTTLTPEDEKLMNEQIIIDKTNKKSVDRFKNKARLIWGDVKEMTNFGVNIAFHDLLLSNSEKNVEGIIKHLEIAQKNILEMLQGRGCKFIAEPNGEKIYIESAQIYPKISTMTLQSQGLILYPFRENSDLYKVSLERTFYESPSLIQDRIQKEMNYNVEDRTTIYIGMHNSDSNWVDFLQWLNDNYGQDGNDQVWMPSHDEYYEYNYYRHHSKLNINQTDSRTWKMTSTLKSDQSEYFYYPSVTVNVSGIRMEDIERIESSNDVTGLSYANYGDGIMLNIDCRKYLIEHAENFVKRYEKDPTNTSNQTDALYFANMLKDSDKKTNLLNRINMKLTH